MTKDDWKKVEEWWGIGFGSVNLKIDGFNVTLHNEKDVKKMKMFVAVYVDHYIRGEWSNQKSEIGNKFWRRVKKAYYSPQSMKKRIKILGKREAKQMYYEYNDFKWTSYRSFKKHICDNNSDIELESL